ncbi:hypothetical protein OCK74_08810 [Chitinophagaceae bacterium LB-8]|uniref:Uncharacterized protein n=1 Tax=Paraflavisolibacter caeni TaxID=2982496 RepID=A0A9X2XU06_9BACT|nr:hypothetical protein [Paraflavisolibacter caeni]MCU7549214.1 hypothetical protein [Paraflavisolibacter caeni]
MDNKLLDDILIKLSSINGQIAFSIFVEENPELYKHPRFKKAFRYLAEEGYITHDNTFLGLCRLTAKGYRFVEEGGYSADENYKLQTLEFARKSKNYAFWALLISLLGVIISIILFLIEKK